MLFTFSWRTWLYDFLLENHALWDYTVEITWFLLLLSYQANPADPRTFPFILLGNKIDIDGGNSRVVSTCSCTSGWIHLFPAPLLKDSFCRFLRRKLGIGAPQKGTYLTLRHLLRRTTMLMPHFCVLLKLLLLMIVNMTCKCNLFTHVICNWLIPASMIIYHFGFNVILLHWRTMTLTPDPGNDHLIFFSTDKQENLVMFLLLKIWN